MKAGERIQYACGHYLIAGEFGIQDAHAREVTKKRCGACNQRLRDGAPRLLGALKRLMAYSNEWLQYTDEPDDMGLSLAVTFGDLREAHSAIDQAEEIPHEAP